MRKRILFISRKYPPSIGGMQTYVKNLLINLEKMYDVDAILLRKNQWHLLWFLPYALIKSVFLSTKKQYDIFYMGDALLAPLGLLLKKLFNGKVIVTVHGLDITYANPVYQKLVPNAVSGFDKVICVSRNTMEECKKRGVPSSVCVFIPNGMDPDEHYLGISREECVKRLEDALNMNLNNKIILLTTGRLVMRKGVDWFVENVFLRLGNDFIYLICGKGPLKNRVGDIIKRHNLQGRVILLNEVGGGILKLIYNCADVFVMPNQRVKGDIEGFGIVAIESAGCGTPVVANNVDGLSEAVLNGKTGWLVEDNDVQKFLEKIENPGLDRSMVRQEAMVFSWHNIIEKYKSIIETV